jgi:hypothetical protein
MGGEERAQGIGHWAWERPPRPVSTSGGGGGVGWRMEGGAGCGSVEVGRRAQLRTDAKILETPKSFG